MITFERAFNILLIGSFITAIIVAIIGCCCLTPGKLLMKMFPYVKRRGKNVVIFDFIISKYLIVFHSWNMTLAIALYIFDALFNTIFIISDKYSPGLHCVALYNGSFINLETEEQAEMANVTDISCINLTLNITGGIGHAAGVLALSWVLASIVLWIKLNWYYKVSNCRKNGKNCCIRALGCCGYMSLLLFQLIFLLGIVALIFVVIKFLNNFYIMYTEAPDFMLAIFIVITGMLVVPTRKKATTLAEYCKEAVQNKQGEEEEALEEIRNRLRRRVYGHQIQVDLLLELAELECKKALADLYYYSIDEDKDEDDRNTINEDEMKTIAQVAYRKITPHEREESDGQQYNTRQGASINDPTERDRLLGNTRRNNNY